MNIENTEKLEWLLNYEVKQSIRHRRFIALLVLSGNGNGDLEKLDRLLKGAVRDSDPVFSLTDAIAVLMGETDTKGALNAVERYRRMINLTIEVRYSVASFPGDGNTPEHLINAALRRLTLANELDSGSVVTEG